MNQKLMTVAKDVAMSAPGRTYDKAFAFLVYESLVKIRNKTILDVLVLIDNHDFPVSKVGDSVNRLVSKISGLGNNLNG